VATRKETRFLGPLSGRSHFCSGRKETGTQVVNIRVNCGSKKRNPVSRSTERAQGLVRRRGLVTKPLLRTRFFGGRSLFCPQAKKPGFYCGQQKRNPVSRSPERAQGLVRLKSLLQTKFGRSHFGWGAMGWSD
jgi:hypothetical protein